MNVDEMWTTVRAFAGDHPVELTIAGAALALGLLAVVVLLVLRALKGRNFNAKASIGFGVVQAGVAFITITGVFEFWSRLVRLPGPEAALLAGFIEACTWAAVGFVFTHGKGAKDDGTANEGFGPAGPFFWVTVVGGGTLAVLGSEHLPIAIGRIVVVVLGAYMWYLRLLQVTHRSGTPSQWQWTPNAFLLAIGAKAPKADDEIDQQAREWEVRKIARAIRWADSGQPWKWFGSRSLVKRAENTTEDVLAEGRRRFAAAHVLKTQVKPDSPIMVSLIAAVQQANAPDQDEVREVREVRDTDAELERAREEHAAELNALRDELSARERSMAELEQQVAHARSADDAAAELARVRAQLEQLEQLHHREQAATTAADRAALQQQQRAEQLEAALGEVMAELDKMRRESDQRVAAIADDLTSDQVEPEAVMAKYGVSRRTAQRLIQQARKLNDERQTAERPRSLTVVNGR